MPYSHLLVPSDGSDRSLRAVREAVGLAAALGSRITVLTVEQQPRMPVPGRGERLDAATLATMKRVFTETGQIVDPHSAIGLAAAAALAGKSDGPVISLACAHPAKFPDAVLKATGSHPALPPHLAGLMTADERDIRLPNDPAAVSAYLSKALSAGAIA